MSARFEGENAMVIGDYYPAPVVERSETPFEREIDRRDFGPRLCPGFDYGMGCETRIEGPQYHCAACTAKAEAFRARLRAELRL